MASHYYQAYYREWGVAWEPMWFQNAFTHSMVPFLTAQTFRNEYWTQKGQHMKWAHIEGLGRDNLTDACPLSNSAQQHHGVELPSDRFCLLWLHRTTVSIRRVSKCFSRTTERQTARCYGHFRVNLTVTSKFILCNIDKILASFTKIRCSFRQSAAKLLFPSTSEFRWHSSTTALYQRSNWREVKMWNLKNR